MSRKIFFSLTVVSLLAAVWFYQHQQSSGIVSMTPSDTETSFSAPTRNVSSDNSTGLPGNSDVTEGEVLAQSGDLDLESIKKNSVDVNEQDLEKKIVTYTKSNGQQVELTVISGANVTDIVPLN